MVNTTALLCACPKSEIFFDYFLRSILLALQCCCQVVLGFFFCTYFLGLWAIKPHLVVCSLLNRNKTRCGANGNETQENCKILVSIKRGRHTASNNEQTHTARRALWGLQNKMCKHYIYTDMNTTTILKHLKGYTTIYSKDKRFQTWDRHTKVCRT